MELCIIRRCHKCGVRLTEENNKCGYEICDKCNEWLEEHCGEKSKKKEVAE